METTFLNGLLDVQLYLCFPKGCGVFTGKVVRLLHSIYGLRQASHVWNNLLDAELAKLGYKQIHADFCIYVYRDGDVICFLAVYVDDMALPGTDCSVMAEHKCLLSLCFKIRDLGPVKQILGHEIDYDHEHQVIQLFQTCYIQESREHYNITDGHSYPTPLVQQSSYPRMIALKQKLRRR